MSKAVKQHPKKHLIPKEVDVLTEKQKREYKEAYELFRRNRKGIYAGEDLKWVLYSMNFTPSLEEIRDFSDAVAKDGVIEWDGFLNIVIEILRSSDKKYQLREAFMTFDKDGSGSIDRGELKEIMLKIMPGQYTEAEVDALLDKADLDGDGEIDFEEFCSMMEGQENDGNESD